MEDTKCQCLSRVHTYRHRSLRNAMQKTSSDSDHSQPGPAQPLRPIAAPNLSASQQPTQLVYVTKPSVDELHIHWVKAFEVLLQVLFLADCRGIPTMLACIVHVLSPCKIHVYFALGCHIVELSEDCRRMLPFPTFWPGKSERHTCTRHPAARGHRVLLPGWFVRRRRFT